MFLLTLVVAALDLPVKRVRGDRAFVYEVADFEFWKRATASDNPYGCKLWPGALGVASRLEEMAEQGSLGSVLEIGAGNGLVSLTAAALGGTVLATDISARALELASRAAKDQNLSLETLVFDVCGPAPLPGNFSLLCVADCLYDDDLAANVARRVVEANTAGKEVLVGSDPSRPSRSAFLDRLRRHIPDAAFEPSTTVALEDAKWKAKRVEILHLKPRS